MIWGCDNSLGDLNISSPCSHKAILIPNTNTYNPTKEQNNNKDSSQAQNDMQTSKREPPVAMRSYTLEKWCYQHCSLSNTKDASRVFSEMAVMSRLVEVGGANTHCCGRCSLDQLWMDRSRCINDVDDD
jgi:hypothetical protein